MKNISTSCIVIFSFFLSLSALADGCSFLDNLHTWQGTMTTNSPSKEICKYSDVELNGNHFSMTYNATDGSPTSCLPSRRWVTNIKCFLGGKLTAEVGAVTGGVPVHGTISNNGYQLTLSNDTYPFSMTVYLTNTKIKK